MPRAFLSRARGLVHDRFGGRTGRNGPAASGRSSRYRWGWPWRSSLVPRLTAGSVWPYLPVPVPLGPPAPQRHTRGTGPPAQLYGHRGQWPDPGARRAAALGRPQQGRPYRCWPVCLCLGLCSAVASIAVTVRHCWSWWRRPFSGPARI